MSAAPLDAKSPKIPRFKTQGEPPRQVHFEPQQATNGVKPKGNIANTGRKTPPPGKTRAAATGPDNSVPVNTQPSSFPAVGTAPDSGGFPGGEWHTAVDPTRSISLPGQLPGISAHPQPASSSSTPLQNHLGGIPFFSGNQTHTTYIGTGGPQPPTCHSAPRPPGSNMAADYANAAPPPMGVNFQPPVPDTTFGPMMHTFVPRFDGAPYNGVHVGLPPAAPQPAVHVVPAAHALHPRSPWYYLYHYPVYGGGPAHYYYPAYAGVPGQPGYVCAQQPPMMQQPVAAQQPVMFNGQAYIPAGGQPPFQAAPPQGFAAQGPQGGAPFLAGNAGPQAPPEVAGLGRTPNEEMLRQVQFAHANKLFESQDFKPADDDPSRFYYVREVDGNWTQRNRFTIDHMGDCRWYVTDEGWFYAVRLPS